MMMIKPNWLPVCETIGNNDLVFEFKKIGQRIYEYKSKSNKKFENRVFKYFAKYSAFFALGKFWIKLFIFL